MVVRRPDIPEELICKRITKEEGEPISDSYAHSICLSVVSCLLAVIIFFIFSSLHLFVEGPSRSRMGGGRQQAKVT